jgi:hypothetical protein
VGRRAGSGVPNSGMALVGCIMSPKP